MQICVTNKSKARDECSYYCLKLINSDTSYINKLQCALAHHNQINSLSTPWWYTVSWRTLANRMNYIVFHFVPHKVLCGVSISKKFGAPNLLFTEYIFCLYEGKFQNIQSMKSATLPQVNLRRLSVHRNFRTLATFSSTT
jgi:hypothetical protein